MSSLYHFTNLKKAISEILPSLTLKTNLLSQTNDPRETFVWTFGGVNIAKDGEKYSVETAFILGKEVKNRCQILCFTQGESGFKNEMMWAHYGENHEGICLEIDESEFLTENQEILKSGEHFFEKVDYDPKSPKPGFHRSLGQTYEEAMTNFIIKYNKELFFQKSKYWSAENEKRIVIVSKGFDGVLSIKSSLRSVILGIYTTESILPSIEYLIRNTNSKIKQCIFGLNDKNIKLDVRLKGEYSPDVLKQYLKKYRY